MIADVSSLNEFIGSSTMAALTIFGDKLQTCYIGDSGFVIFRLVDGQYKLEFEFKDQQHGFNFPYQLAMEEYYGDDPYLSICQEFVLHENDIIVVGTDGLFDNVFVTEIMNLVNMNKENDEKLFTVPETLAQIAITRGDDTQFKSPFSINAK
jgi:protein phosphatase PTC7